MVASRQHPFPKIVAEKPQLLRQAPMLHRKERVVTYVTIVETVG